MRFSFYNVMIFQPAIYFIFHLSPLMANSTANGTDGIYIDGKKLVILELFENQLERNLDHIADLPMNQILDYALHQRDNDLDRGPLWHNFNEDTPESDRLTTNHKKLVSTLAKILSRSGHKLPYTTAEIIRHMSDLIWVASPVSLLPRTDREAWKQNSSLKIIGCAYQSDDVILYAKACYEDASVENRAAMVLRETLYSLQNKKLNPKDAVRYLSTLIAAYFAKKNFSISSEQLPEFGFAELAEKEQIFKAKFFQNDNDYQKQWHCKVDSKKVKAIELSFSGLYIQGQIDFANKSRPINGSNAEVNEEGFYLSLPTFDLDSEQIALELNHYQEEQVLELKVSFSGQLSGQYFDGDGWRHLKGECK